MLAWREEELVQLFLPQWWRFIKLAYISPKTQDQVEPKELRKSAFGRLQTCLLTTQSGHWSHLCKPVFGVGYNDRGSLWGSLWGSRFFI